MKQLKRKKNGYGSTMNQKNKLNNYKNLKPKNNNNSKETMSQIIKLKRKLIFQHKKMKS